MKADRFRGILIPAMKKTFFEFSERTGFTHLLQKAWGGKNRLYVLAYHRIGELPGDPTLEPGLVNAFPAQFEAQMDLLTQRYHPVTAVNLLDAIQHGSPLPRDAVLVTFDDGYRDFQDIAFPIMQRRGIRPILFVATGCVGRDVFWWDELHRVLRGATQPEVTSSCGVFSLRTRTERETAFRRWQAYVKHAPFEQARAEIAALHAAVAPDMAGGSTTLSWDELRALDRAGVTIAAHTHTHPILSHISAEAAREEIRVSQRIIGQEIGHVLPIFAYPDGREMTISPEIAAILREEGFTLAFTMIEGSARLAQDDPLLLPRIGTRPSSTLAAFHAHLTPGYDHWKRTWR